jgi:hypothetical protein
MPNAGRRRLAASHEARHAGAFYAASFFDVTLVAIDEEGNGSTRLQVLTEKAIALLYERDRQAALDYISALARGALAGGLSPERGDNWLPSKPSNAFR